MDELMLMEYLKSQGMSEQDFKDKFKEFITKHNRGSYNRGSYNRGSFEGSRNRGSDEESYNEMNGFGWEQEGMGDFSFNRGMNMRRNKGMSDEFSNDHFIPAEAKYVVSEMYHTENGRRYTGEKYDFEKAKEVCERYRGFLPSSVNPVDVYVAINAQYHDYAKLFKSWFGDRIDHKIIESAIVFWFKDEDNLGTSKLVNYFREK